MTTLSLKDLLNLLDAKKSGGSYVACCPAHNDKTPSLSIDEGLNVPWVVRCHSGCTQEDVLKAISKLQSSSGSLKSIANSPMPPTNELQEIQKLYNQALPLEDENSMPLIKYLLSRKLNPALMPDMLRLHKSHGYYDKDKQFIGDFPTALFPITLQKQLIGLQRIYLMPDGSKAHVEKPKKIKGTFTRGGIYFDGEDIDEAIVAEGPETTLALREALGLPGISCISSSGMGSIELPKNIKKVIVCADLDRSGSGQKAARGLVKRLFEEGREVYLLMPDGPIPEDQKGVDFLDEFNAKGAEHLNEKLKKAKIWKPVTTGQKEFVLEPLSKLMKEEGEQHEWLVDEVLLKSSISILAGKPKAGKTTLARQLAYCVATGANFLGFKTLKGSVIYLALEEKRNEVKKHFVAMGATGDEDIHIHAAAAPKDALVQLTTLIDIHRPTLVIIDPLFRFTRVANSNDYSEVTNALENVVALARETEAHILLVHHMGKSDRDGADGILGSTAIFGAVDAALLMNRNENYRSLKSVQRYGTDIEERILDFDQNTRMMTLGAEKTEIVDIKFGEAILSFLSKKKRSCTQTEIFEALTGNKAVKIAALRSLVEDGRVKKDGDGKKGKAFQYSISSINEDSSLSLEGKTENWNLDEIANAEDY